jgi:hypothetical protein
MLSEIRVFASEEGLDRRDVATGIMCAKTILGLKIRNGFDPEAHTCGIAHVNMLDGKGHFVGIRRIFGKLCILDSLNGRIAPITDMDAFLKRSTTYCIVH